MDKNEDVLMAIKSKVTLEVRSLMMDGVPRTAWDVAAILGVARDPDKIHRIGVILSDEYDNGIYSRRTMNKYRVVSNTNHWAYTIRNNKGGRSNGQ